MPRPNLGPRIKLRQEPGWTQALYYVVWNERGRTRKESLDTGDLDEAQARFADWLQDWRRKTAIGPRDPSEVSVRDILEDYAAEHGDEVNSPATLAYAIEPLLAYFGERTVEDLTTGVVKGYWTWRKTHSVRQGETPSERIVVQHGAVRATDPKTRKPVHWRAGASEGTIIRELSGTLRPALDHAQKQKRLKTGTYFIPVPQAPTGRDYWITRAEAARLLWHSRRDYRARGHLPLYIMILLYTGQRRGAVLDLQWSQVDFIRSRINFNAPGRKQTKKLRPIIPIPRGLLAHLRRAHAKAISSYVITSSGERVSIRKGFATAARRAGIPNCTSHTLRHTAGTWMAQRGVSLRDIGGWLGHSDARTTELYAHHHPDFMDAARRSFE